jgi:hypothetical protein
MAHNLQQKYPPATRGKVVVWGYLGAYPFGGMTWQVLHYLAGLRKLGFDVWYVEDTDAEVRDPVTLWDTDNYQPNVDYLQARMDSIGLVDRWIFRPPGIYDNCLGATGIDGLAALYRDADAVINLCGSHELRADHDDIKCLVYLETDPVPKQIAVATGDEKTLTELGRYQHLFTYGENLGAEDCKIPLEVFDWRKTRPPVIVDWWQSPNKLAPDAAFSSVTSWTHSWNDVMWQGETWRWSKHHEFRRFKSLPEKSSVRLELAVTGMNDAEAEEFRKLGWRLRPASEVSDPDVYRDYIRNSLGEFTVAKEQYVLPRTGWFSDRSVCYLASGRPVITQETGFSKFLPCGEGLIPFVTEQDAADALAAATDDYERQCAAATTIARECFAADDVLRRMMSAIGLL